MIASQTDSSLLLLLLILKVAQIILHSVFVVVDRRGSFTLKPHLLLRLILLLYTLFVGW